MFGTSFPTASFFALRRIVIFPLITGFFLMALKPALAQEEREPQSPVYSRDGKRIVYTQAVTKAGEILPSSYELWIANRDGSGALGLTEGPADTDPRISPDDSQIVFSRGHDLWIVKADGSGAHNVTNTAGPTESAPEFTNDGQSLLFLRTSAKENQAVPAEAVDNPPMLWGMGEIQTVVLRDLQTGAERVILGDGYGVRKVVPNYDDDQNFTLLCGPIDDEGKPKNDFGAQEVASLKLGETVPHSVFRPKPGTKITLKGLRVRPNRTVYEIDLSDKIGTFAGVVQNGDLVLLPDLPLFGDVSTDGNTIIGTDSAEENGKFVMRLAEYDIPTGKTRFLGQPAVKTPEAPVPVTPPVPVKTISEAAQKLLESGKEFSNDQKYPEAIRDFTRAIQLYPAFAEAYYLRGESHYYADEEAPALKDLTEAIRLNPKFSDAYLTRGQLHAANDETGDALADFDAAVESDPKNYLALENRGDLHVKIAELDEALADYDEVLKLDPDNLVVYMSRGEVLTQVKDNPAALKNYTAAIAKFPNFAEAYLARAKTYRALGQNQLALADEQKAKALKAKPQ